MSGEITADLTKMAPTNLLIIFGGLILVMIVAAFLVKKFNLVVSKGAIKVSDYEYDQQCQNIIYHLQDTIENVDYETKNAIRRQTKACNYKIAKIGTISELCQTARRSLYHAFKEPFYDYINANHFTRELRPDNFESYRKNLIDVIQELHQELMFEYQSDDCDKNTIDEWDLVDKQFERLVDDWLMMVMVEVKKSCARKIQIYNQLLPEVKDSKHWNEVLTGCISKNEEYMSNIKTLVDELTRKYKDVK